MDFDTFIKQVSRNKKFNPFHSDFSHEELFIYLKENLSLDNNEEKNKIITFSIYVLLTNPKYKEYYNDLELIMNEDYLVRDFFLYSIIIANKDAMAITDILDHSTKESGVISAFVTVNSPPPLYSMVKVV